MTDILVSHFLLGDHHPRCVCIYIYTYIYIHIYIYRRYTSPRPTGALGATVQTKSLHRRISIAWLQEKKWLFYKKMPADSCPFENQPAPAALLDLHLRPQHRAVPMVAAPLAESAWSRATAGP
jgi:hypothetical protein